MKITPDPVWTVMDFTQADKLYQVEVQGKKVIDFGASSGWVITKVGITKDYHTLTLTVQKVEDEQDG